jgi:cystathionine beta-lyase
MKFNTKTIHGGQDNIDPAYNSVMPPIYQTSTYSQTSPGKNKGYEYSRGANPTRSALEKSIASLENGKHGLAFASGLAAVDAILKLLKPGDEVLSSNDLYGGSYRLFTKIFENLGVKFHFLDLSDIQKVKELINTNTKMIWAETPTNPMMQIVDISALAEISSQHDLWLCVDNTFATPYLQQPLELGASIVMHSATKYLGGHSDLILGTAVINDDRVAERLSFIRNTSGAVPGPMDCFLALRGIKTLHVRMDRHCENGRAVAEFLQEHPKVKKVYWPGFPENKNYNIAKSQMKDFGGMVSFTNKDNSYDDAIRFIKRLKVFTLAESLGGVESLAGHSASMTHGSIPKAEREKTGIVDSLIRLSVGIEDKDDLLQDLEQALQA